MTERQVRDFMPNKVWITNEQNKVEFTPAMRRLIRKSCNAVLVNEGMLFDCEISVTLVSDEEIAKRKAEMPLKRKEVSGYLKRYAAQVSSADKGAIINK